MAAPSRIAGVPGRGELDTLLDEMLERPERRPALEAQVEKTFVESRAVLVLDMSGFSRTTQSRGIVEFLLLIRRLRRMADPIVARHRGDVVKSEADNLFCVFPSARDALAAAREIVQGHAAARAALPRELQLYVSIGIGFGRVLLIGDEDLFGGEVNLASKLGEDIAGDGEILLTQAAHAELGDVTGEPEERTVSISGLELRHYPLM